MSHDKDNPISNETGEYLQELTEKGAEKDERTYLVGEHSGELLVQKKEPVRRVQSNRIQGKGGK